MSKKIIVKGSTTFRATCRDCGTCFTYERDDVRQNYVRGGEWVSCPLCGQQCRHLGRGNDWHGRHGAGSLSCAS